jgi:hypothetical protein
MNQSVHVLCRCAGMPCRREFIRMVGDRIETTGPPGRNGTFPPEQHDPKNVFNADEALALRIEHAIDDCDEEYVAELWDRAVPYQQ